MKRIVLVACSAKKAHRPAKVDELYEGCLFVASLAYARKIGPDAIYILSAKHHLLNPDCLIEPYDVALKQMSVADRQAWANEVIRQLAQVADLHADKFIILAGERYREYLLPHITHREVPLCKLRYGEQVRYLRSRT